MSPMAGEACKSAGTDEAGEGKSGKAIESEEKSSTEGKSGKAIGEACKSAATVGERKSSAEGKWGKAVGEACKSAATGEGETYSQHEGKSSAEGKSGKAIAEVGGNREGNPIAEGKSGTAEGEAIGEDGGKSIGEGKGKSIGEVKLGKTPAEGKSLGEGEGKSSGKAIAEVGGNPIAEGGGNPIAEGKSGTAEAEAIGEGGGKLNGEGKGKSIGEVKSGKTPAEGKSEKAKGESISEGEGESIAKGKSIADQAFDLIPDSLFWKILELIPPLMLWQLRFVSTKWDDTIKDREFCRQHSDKIRSPLLAVSIWNSPHEGKEKQRHRETLFQFRTLTEDSVDEIQLQLKVPGVHHIISSVDGFLMLATGESGFSLLNPLTQELRTVACPISWDKVGFAKVRDIYKIVFLSDSRCAIGLLGSEEWSYKPFSNNRFSYNKFNTCLVDKKQYWLGHDTRKKDAIILVFDFETEEFSTISPPPFLRYPDEEEVFECSQISEQDGKITLCAEAFPGMLNVWVKEEYQNYEWRHMASMAFPGHYDFRYQHDYRLIKLFREEDEEEGDGNTNCLMLFSDPDIIHFMYNGEVKEEVNLGYHFDEELEAYTILHPTLHSFSISRLEYKPKKEVQEAVNDEI